MEEWVLKPVHPVLVELPWRERSAILRAGVDALASLAVVDGAQETNRM